MKLKLLSFFFIISSVINNDITNSTSDIDLPALRTNNNFNQGYRVLKTTISDSSVFDLTFPETNLTVGYVLRYYFYTGIDLNSNTNELIIDGSSYKGNAPIDAIVGTWWNHEIVQAKKQISAISGRIIDQTVTFIGKEEITIGSKTYNSLHFNFKSSDKSLPDSKKLNTDIWYDENSLLWLKASFDKTGHWEYRLKKYN
jgi:hypothetical protein